MDKKHKKMIAFLFFFILFIGIIAGCVEEEQKPDKKEIISPAVELDKPSILPDWKDGEYHDYYDTMELLNGFNEKYPELVYVYSIGESVLGKDIWCIRITNEKNNAVKSSCLIDGCIHGNEWEADEACLYLAEYLLINFGKNETITGILNNSEVYIVPLVNPDSRQENVRWNDNGVNVNSNFDIFFGKLRGRCFRLGKLFGRIKIPYIEFPRLGIWFDNCGRHAFSEPESQALRDLMKSLNDHDFSFYVNCHTATHEIVAPWDTLKPPFPMEQEHEQILRDVGNWVEKNTEYEYSMNSALNYGGDAMDWCYKTYRIPSFVFEILSEDYEPWFRGGKHDNLVHWMKTILPFFMYLLVNIENLHNWDTPDIRPPLPEGVPPEPLK